MIGNSISARTEADKISSLPALLRRISTTIRANFWLQTLFIVVLAIAIFGPFINLMMWSVTESWYFPHSLPNVWGLRYWYEVFSPYSDVSGSLMTSVGIAVAATVFALIISIPAGYALSHTSMPYRLPLMLLFLLPQAFPNLTVYMNIAKMFYQIGLNGTIVGVVLVHTVHGLMYSIWITVAAFSAQDPLMVRAARNLGAGPIRTFFMITLPMAAPGIMASGIFVFLESLDEFTGTFFVGAPEVNTLPLLLYTASMEGNYQISSITALILLVPSIVFMIIIQKFMRPDTLAKLGK
ncbi:MAG: ABC transporter permease [Vibrio sp.]